MDDLEYWVRRFEHFDVQSRALFDRATNLVAISLTVLSGTAGVALAYSRNEILIVIPFVVLIVWALGLRMVHEQLLLAAYRDYAEEQMRNGKFTTEESASEFLVWHSFGGRRMVTLFPNLFMYVLLGGLSLILALGSVVLLFVFGVYSPFLPVVVSVLTMFGLIAGLYGVCVLWRDVSTVYEKLRSEIG